MSDQLERLKSALADRYTLERELGAGGMATVYLADDPRHHRKVALKVLRPDLAATLGPQRFLREVTIAANLQHPHILPLLDSGEAAGLLYYVMPYVAGETLRARLQRATQLGVDDALRITRALAAAVDYAHDQGVIHRDLKPENILFQAEEPVLADFGIALAVKAAGGARLTETGLSLGTPQYMSPEQAAGDRTLDARSDVYSLGAVVYEMLAGEPPHTGPTVAAVIMKAMTQAPVPLSVVRPGLLAGVEAAVLKALAKAPADRFASAGAFAAALAGGPDATRRDTSPAAPEKSIVVLPFANLSPDPDNEYFADGLMEEVIADLYKVRALKVISRTSAIKLKGTDWSLQRMGRELKVRYVLEGSVRKAGNSLRITAQLMDAETDAHLWAEKYSGTMEDVFDLQERLSRQIVEALKVTLTPAEDRRLAERPIQDLQAFEYYQRARQEVNRFTRDSLARARGLLDQALKLGVENPELYGLMGNCELSSIWLLGESEGPAFARAEGWARMAFARDPDSGAGHMLMSGICYRRGEIEDCVRHGERACRAEPAITDARFWLACGLAIAGRLDRMRDVMQRAVEIDPLTAVNHGILACADMFGERPERGLEHTAKGLEIDPFLCNVRQFHCLCLLRTGRRDEAGQHFELMARDRPDDGFAQVGMRLWRALNGNRQAALAPLTDAARSVAIGDEFWAYLVAAGYALVGESDQAMTWLEHAVKVRGWFDYIYFTKYDPFLTSLHPDPRFQALMAAAKERYDRFDA